MPMKRLINSVPNRRLGRVGAVGLWTLAAVVACRTSKRSSSAPVPGDANPPLVLPSPTSEKEGPTQNTGSTLVWLSLDGLQLSVLKPYVDALPNPSPFGLKYLLSKSNWNPELLMSNPTITASSHISTITCSFPGQHGIFANSQWDGNKKVSGFSAPFQGESFPQVLSRAGIKTGVYAYPGFDFSEENRKADYVGAYFNEKAKHPDVKTFVQSEPQKWVLPTPEGGSFVLESSWNGNSEALEFRSGLEGQPQSTVVALSPGKWGSILVKNGLVSVGRVDLYFTKSEDKITIFVSAVSQNNASPEPFAQELASRDEFFSIAKQFSLIGKFGPSVFVEAMNLRTKHFLNTVSFLSQKPDLKALFFYLEDLDTLGHQFANGSASKEIISKQVERLDQELGPLMARWEEQKANVVVMGDHGMSAIQYTFNLASIQGLLPFKNFFTMTSGGTALFYPPQNGEVTSLPPLDQPEFKVALEALQNATVEFDGNRKLFQEVVVKGTSRAKDLGLDGPSMPWIVAIAPPGISLDLPSGNTKPLLAKSSEFKLPEVDSSKLATWVDSDLSQLRLPVPVGQHGHWAASSEMRSSLLMFGPELDMVDAKRVEKNVDVVPQVAKALGWPLPKQCQK